MKRLNDLLGDRMAFGLATMTCFWIVFWLVILPLFWQRPTDLVGWVQYIVQSFFQGIALPVLAFVARIQGDKQERLLKETHDAIMSVLEDIKDTHSAELKEIEELNEVITLLNGGKNHDE